jgi:hypothetical protein
LIVRFSAGYRGGGLRSNSESQSDKKLCREFSSSDAILQLEFHVILNHNLEEEKKEDDEEECLHQHQQQQQKTKTKTNIDTKKN